MVWPAAARLYHYSVNVFRGGKTKYARRSVAAVWILKRGAGGEGDKRKAFTKKINGVDRRFGLFVLVARLE